MTTDSRTKSIDMLQGPLTGRLILFALPIAFSSMLQQLFNAADTAVVGRFADADALAAVGTNGEIVALLVTLSAGLAVGANVLIAQYIGERKQTQISRTLHTSLVCALLFGLLGAVLGQWISAPLLRMIRTPEAVLTDAVLYLRIYFCGLPFLMLYDFGAAIFRSKGNSRLPFLILTLSGIVNVALNLLFVLVCGLGVAGVAVATDLAAALSAALVLFCLHREKDEFHLSFRSLRIHREYLLPLLSIGVPAAVQGAVFCLANIFVQASVNSFGAIATAGSTIAMNFEYFGYYMITAFGQAATTFTGQNYAAKETDRCMKILIRSLLLSFLFSSAIMIPLTVGRSFFSGLFSRDSEVIYAACVRILLILSLEPFCSLYEIPAGSLRGTGHSTLPAVLTILGTCVLRIVWIFTVFAHFSTLESLLIVFPISWLMTILLTVLGFLVIRPFRHVQVLTLHGSQNTVSKTSLQNQEQDSSRQ